MTGTITGVGVVTPTRLQEPPIAELLQGERLRTLNVESTLALAAARVALRDAGLDGEQLDPERLGVVVATRHAGLGDYVELFRAGTEGDRPRVNPARGPHTGLNGPAAQLSIRLGAAGPNATVSSEAAGGLSALRYAGDALAGERATAMLVCGVDVRPDVLRAPGEVPAEPSGCAAVLVVEAEPAARARATNGHAGVSVGVAAVATAYSPRDDVAEAHARALHDALREAGVAHDAVQATFAPADSDGNDGEGAGVIAQLAHAAQRMRRRETTGPALVSARSACGGAGVAVLVGVDAAATEQHG